MSARARRPKLFKNLCLSLVSGVPHFFFRATPLVDTDGDLLVFGGELLLGDGQRRVGGGQLADELRRLAHLGLGRSPRLLADLRLDADIVQLGGQHRRLAVEQRHLLATTRPVDMQAAAVLTAHGRTAAPTCRIKEVARTRLPSVEFRS